MDLCAHVVIEVGKLYSDSTCPGNQEALGPFFLQQRSPVINNVFSINR